MATAIECAGWLNQALEKTGYPYRIDTTNEQTASDGIKTIGAFPPSQLNAIMDQYNAILIFRNYGLMFRESDDPTRTFWRDFVNYGGGIEDIYHKIIDEEPVVWAEDFSGLSAEQSQQLGQKLAGDAYSFKKEDVIKKFHTDMDGFRLKLSRSDLAISEVFTPEGIVNYTDVQIANLQWSANVHLQKHTIACIKKMIDDNKIIFKTGYNPNTPSGVTSIVEGVKTCTDAFKAPSDKFNYSQVLNKSDEEDIYLVVTPEFLNRIETRGYANAFNLNEYRIKNRLIVLPYGTDFGTFSNEKVLAVLLDKRAIVMALRYWKMMPNIVPNSDFINYFLNVKFISGYNEFFNAVAFTGGEVSENFQNDVAEPNSPRKCYIMSGEILGISVNGEYLSDDYYYNGQEYLYIVNEGDVVDMHYGIGEQMKITLYPDFITEGFYISNSRGGQNYGTNYTGTLPYGRIVVEKIV